MDDLPHSTPEDVAKRLRSLGEGLTDPADVAAVNKYVDELERKAKISRNRTKEGTQEHTDTHERRLAVLRV
jgi:hypothetical protein